MKPFTVLKIILLISLCGLAFSGYLSYGELTGTCTVGCSAIEPSKGILGIPACVYGFFMYLTVAVVTLVGLRKK